MIEVIFYFLFGELTPLRSIGFHHQSKNVSQHVQTLFWNIRLYCRWIPVIIPVLEHFNRVYQLIKAAQRAEQLY